MSNKLSSSLITAAIVALSTLARADSLHFDTEEINVGQIDVTVIDTLLCTFDFQNQSDSPIWFTRGKVSCECSTMDYPTDTILPQQIRTITTYTATHELEQEFARFFMLTDQKGAEYVLVVSGEVCE